MTHEEYLELSRTGDSLEAFHMYYGQFVTPYVTELVRGRIGEDRIRASKDVHFNDIPSSCGMSSFRVSCTTYPSGTKTSTGRGACPCASACAR